jgi:pimeloyl-ACP methyl ester carboxylesterase
MDEMKIKRFSVLAHSAGCPYALAAANRMKERVIGKIHLLAPWVGTDIDNSEFIHLFPFLRVLKIRLQVAQMGA